MNKYAQGSLKKLLNKVDTASIEAFNDRVKKHPKDLDDEGVTSVKRMINNFEIYPNEPENNLLINDIKNAAQENISRSRLQIVKDEMKKLTYGEQCEMAEGIKAEALEKDKFGDLAPMLWRWAVK